MLTFTVANRTSIELEEAIETGIQASQDRK